MKAASTYNGVKTIYLINGVGKSGQIYAKNETRPPTYTTYKINSKWIKDLNVRVKIIKLLEENIGSKTPDISLSNIFDTYLWTRETKTK